MHAMDVMSGGNKGKMQIGQQRTCPKLRHPLHPKFLAACYDLDAGPKRTGKTKLLEFYFYILECADSTYYTGWGTDPERGCAGITPGAIYQKTYPGD